LGAEDDAKELLEAWLHKGGGEGVGGSQGLRSTELLLETDAEGTEVTLLACDKCAGTLP
jgi:hypothetical protein